MKKAIILTSFGSTHQDTRKKTIEVLAEEIRDLYPDYELRQTFTSKIVRQKVLSRENIKVNSLKEELDLLIKEGVSEVVIQSTHIIPGSEFHKIYMQTKKARKTGLKIKVGQPLLSSPEDYREVVNYLKENFTPKSENEITLFMAHGTSHASFTSYVALAYMLNNSPLYMACVESYPELNDIIPDLKEKQIKKINLRPFMFVAGDHAKNDMAGENPDSWKIQLQNSGFEVQTYIEGLGEYKKIRQILLNHLEKSMKYESRCRHGR
ncbi:sirohydrochlorin cobaltochelatase [Ignavigranum ruoffiae]